MFNSKEEYELVIKNLSEKFYGIYDRVIVLGSDLRSFLSDYTITAVTKEYFDSSFGIALAGSESVSYSLGDVLAGKAVNLGKTYSEVYEKEIEEATNLYAIELETTTGAKIDLVMFKNETLELEFDENELLKIYGIVFDAKKNPGYVDKGGFYGRTLNLYAPVPTFIIGPKEGNMHGVANYSEVTKWKGEDISEFTEEQLEERNKKTPIYIHYDAENPVRHIPRQEGNIVDWDLYYGIQHCGRNYEDIIQKDIFNDNINFTDNDYLNNIKNSYKLPLVNYKYLNRENCATTCFFAEKMNVDVLRLDLTSERSMNSYQMGSGFTSSFDYTFVGKVFAVLPAEMFQHGNDICAADAMVYSGYVQPSRMIFYESKTDETFDKLLVILKSNYKVIDKGNECYEYIDEDIDRNFRTFLVKSGYKYVNNVSKL